MRIKGVLRRDVRGLSNLVVVLVVVVVALVLITFVLYPWLTRDRNYANDPGDPPEEAEEGSDPAWMGELRIKIDLDTGAGWTERREVKDIEIKKLQMDLEPWDGEPWDVASLFPQWLEDPDNFKVSFKVELTKGRTKYEDSGSFKVYENAGFAGWGRSNWFFFWEVQEGNWHFDVTVKCGGYTDHAQGTLGISNGVAVLNMGA